MTVDECVTGVLELFPSADKQAITMAARLMEKSLQPRCKKCGTLTKGEEAWVNGQAWCHPCADDTGEKKDVENPDSPKSIPPESSKEMLKSIATLMEQVETLRAMRSEPVAWRSRESGSTAWRVHAENPTANLKAYASGNYEVEPLFTDPALAPEPMSPHPLDNELPFDTGEKKDVENG